MDAVATRSRESTTGARAPVEGARTPAQGSSPPAGSHTPVDTVSLSADPAAPPPPTPAQPTLQNPSAPPPISALPAPAPTTPAQPTLQNAAAQGAPFDALRGIAQYEHDFYKAPKEPRWLHGLVYEQYPDGRFVDLKRAKETSPDIPPEGPDIPSDAVKDNRVVIYVDGIHQEIATQRDQIHRLFHAARTDPKHGASVDQPVIGIHEATGFNAGTDGTRIAIDLAWLKALQGRWMPTSWIRRASFNSDPVTRSVHNEVRQSLQAGREVQIALHSGGGAETALALSLLAREDGGKWKNAITQHVRILAMAPAVSLEDFELAGVKRENVLYTASKTDPVYRMSHEYMAPWNQLRFAVRAAAVGLELLFNRESIPYHSPDYIFWRNVQPDGTQKIQAYLDGGTGGESILP